MVSVLQAHHLNFCIKICIGCYLRNCSYMMIYVGWYLFYRHSSLELCFNVSIHFTLIVTFQNGCTTFCWDMQPLSLFCSQTFTLLPTQRKERHRLWMKVLKSQLRSQMVLYLAMKMIYWQKKRTNITQHM